MYEFGIGLISLNAHATFRAIVLMLKTFMDEPYITHPIFKFFVGYAEDVVIENATV
jgi:hypothetical protein